MGRWQQNGGLTMQRKANKVREPVSEIGKSMNMGKKQRAGLEQWDLQIDWSVTRLSDMASKQPLWKQYMPDMTSLVVQKRKDALDEFTEVGLGHRKYGVNETATKTGKSVHVGMYFIPQCFSCSYRGCVDTEDDDKKSRVIGLGW